ncbi:MAG: hypothetical protein VX335_04780 [Pseudomonadota bacterium]|nr:hypothetical protein [Pseudomonadota bacterium]
MRVLTMDDTLDQRIKTLHEVRETLKNIEEKNKKREIILIKNYLDCLFDCSLTLPQKDTKEIIKFLDFATLVQGIKKFSHFNDNELKVTTNFRRSIHAVKARNVYLENIYDADFYAKDLNLNGLEKWQAIFLQARLRDICNCKRDLQDLHLPAEFCYLGMTNLRLDNTQIVFKDEKNLSEINIQCIVHGSHVPFMLPEVDKDLMVNITRDSIISLLSANYDRDSSKVELEKFSMIPTAGPATLIGSDELPPQDLYLTTYVSYFNILTQDNSVIDIMRKATKLISNDKSTLQKVYYNNLTIQSSSALFEGYNETENSIVTTAINKRSALIQDYIKSCSLENNYISNKSDIYIDLLTSVNKAYNNAISLRSKFHKLSVTIFYTLLTITTISAAMLLFLITSISSASFIIAIVISVLVFSFQINQKRFSLNDGLLSSKNIVSLLFFFVIFSLSISSVGVIIMPASVNIYGVGLITFGLFIITQIIYDFRAYRAPACMHNTYIAALQDINISLNGDVSDIGYQESKDTATTVRIMTNALLQFYAERLSLPNLRDTSYLRTIIALTLTIAGVCLGLDIILGAKLTSPLAITGFCFAVISFIAGVINHFNPHSHDMLDIAQKISDHVDDNFDADLAHGKIVRGDSLKNFRDCFPTSICENLSKESQSKIKSCAEKSKWFGIQGIKLTLAHIRADLIKDTNQLKLEMQRSEEETNEGDSQTKSSIFFS